MDKLKIDIEKLNQGIEDYIDDSKSDNTKRAYEKDWKDFIKFCKYLNVQYLPADYNTVAKYLVHCSDNLNLKTSTIQRKVASICFKHRESLFSIDRKHKLIKNVIDGIKRKKGTKTDSSEALTIENLKLIIDKMENEINNIKQNNSSLARIYRDKALILIGFKGGFRRSELTNLDFEDIKVELDGLRITIKKSKTDQTASGSHIKGINKSLKGPKYCPLISYESWIKLSGIGSGKVFRQIDRSNRILNKLSDKSVALIIKWRGEKAGINNLKLAGHSLRSGIATALAKEGATENDIKKITGHKSNQMVQRYIQDAEIFENATKLLDL